MRVKFNPRNSIIQLCMKGMSLEESGDREGSVEVFLEAWKQSSNDYEKIIAAYPLGLRQQKVEDKLKWLKNL